MNATHIPDAVMASAEEAYQEAIYMTTEDEPRNMVRMVASAILAERERCALIAETAKEDDDRLDRQLRQHIAADIRKPA